MTKLRIQMALTSLLVLLAGWAFSQCASAEEVEELRATIESLSKEQAALIYEPEPTPTHISAGGIVGWFMFCADVATSPCVVWADPRLRVPPNTCSEIDELRWDAIAKANEPALGPYSLRFHNGFPELAWVTPERETALRDNLTSETPPILFVARSPRYFPKMWEVVSGQPVDVSGTDLPSVVTSPVRSHVSSSEIEPNISELFAEFLQGNGYGFRDSSPINESRLAIFKTAETVPTAMFMKRLAVEAGCSATRAGDGWVLRPLPPGNRNDDPDYAAAKKNIYTRPLKFLLPYQLDSPQPLPIERAILTVQFPLEGPPIECLPDFEDASSGLQALALAGMLDGYGILRVKEIAHWGEGGIRFTGSYSRGTWRLETGRIQGRFLPVYYTYSIASLNAGGFIGVLEKKDNTWVLRLWRRLWIS